MMSSERIEDVGLAPVEDLAVPCVTPKTLNAVVATACIMPDGAFIGIMSAPKMALTLPPAVLLFVSHQGVLVLYLAIAAGDIFNASMLCTATPASSSFTCDVRAGKVGSIDESDLSKHLTR
ncbi:hypothetical protein HPB52_006779 [Rhipicephalus sanguineus]|uniref:Uncharacterized protein n=1 Tax=Rhipicephalus sanguineus TaxID=34632 RepID=A0A9D4T7T0_RHISA|nr:hypothetical protein HPB52_006779 [Rhipicephalus sanguineus]